MFPPPLKRTCPCGGRLAILLERRTLYVRCKSCGKLTPPKPIRRAKARK